MTVAGNPHMHRYARLRRAGRSPTGRRCKDETVPAEFSSETPWLEPAEPVVFVVDAKNKLDLKWLTAALDSEQAGALLRSHLQPISPHDPTYKSNWRMFWRAVGFAGDHPRRRGRAEILALLERWLQDTEVELADAGDPDSDRARVARRFRGDVVQAIDRLEKTYGEPLGWAGPVWSKYPLGPRRVVESLVAVIALHRDKQIEDRELYNILRALNLEPGHAAGRITEANLEVVFNAVANGDPLDFEDEG
jgi:hypothetical protein